MSFFFHVVLSLCGISFLANLFLIYLGCNKATRSAYWTRRIGDERQLLFTVMTMTTMKMLSEMRLTNPVLWFVKITWINRTRKGFANIIVCWHLNQGPFTRKISPSLTSVLHSEIMNSFTSTTSPFFLILSFSSILQSSSL